MKNRYNSQKINKDYLSAIMNFNYKSILETPQYYNNLKQKSKKDYVLNGNASNNKIKLEQMY